jgi:5-methylcytosine-specific restriction endonuclease McrA
MVREGDRAYVYKQGRPPRGIFATGTIVGPAEERRVARRNENRFVVPIEFEVFVDPAERFLVSNDDLLKISVPTPWNTQRSGMPLTPEVAGSVEGLLNRHFSSAWPQSQKARDYARKTERFIEVYERDQALVRDLEELYDGCCQICGSKPFGGDLGRLTEGHHIQWLCRGGSNSRDNLVLLCPNHHAAMHETDPEFDPLNLVFRFGSNSVPIRLDRHLKSVWTLLAKAPGYLHKWVEDRITRFRRRPASSSSATWW